MGERKGTNKYYPPDFDPKKHGSLNGYHGVHALRERARKLDRGILIIRFEMPYNVWCLGCGNHIGMGVRYNAEKTKTGMYYTTPIYKFRMKCHLCDNHFEMQTDPANFEYVIISGLKRKEQRWNPDENEQVAPEEKKKHRKLESDPMFKLEHGKQDVEKAKKSMPSLAELAESREEWLDDFALNQMTRKKFRFEKKEILEKKKIGEALLEKSSLPKDLVLVEESDEDKRLASLIKYKSLETFDERQNKKRKAIEESSVLVPDESTSKTPAKRPKAGVFGGSGTLQSSFSIALSGFGKIVKKKIDEEKSEKTDLERVNVSDANECSYHSSLVTTKLSEPKEADRADIQNVILHNPFKSSPSCSGAAEADVISGHHEDSDASDHSVDNFFSSTKIEILQTASSLVSDLYDCSDSDT